MTFDRRNLPDPVAFYESRGLVLTEQPDIDLAIEGGVATKYAENLIWSREKSKPVDIAGVCAQTWALYALEELEPEKKPTPPPPRAAVLTMNHTDTDREANPLILAF